MKTSLLLLCIALLASCSMEQTLRSDKPLSHEEAEKVLHENLPASASDIYYVFHAGGLQDLESYLRFRIDPAQADQAIETIIAENNRTTERSLPYVRASLPPPQPAKPHLDSSGRFKPITWWQPQTIRNGYFRGEQQSYAIRVWYDTDQSVIYVYQND